ncbi:unnamed protein product [Toxocara canis]|nr:unnamed protein product [Toxocara canis]
MHFDALIYLRGKHLVRRKAVKGKSLQNVLPVCDYDPLGNYLNALRASFGHFAIFFHDKYNGDRIGMVWKPEALKPKEANISNSLYRYLNAEDGTMHLDRQSIREDMVVLGRGIVRNVVLNGA